MGSDSKRTMWVQLLERLTFPLIIISIAATVGVLMGVVIGAFERLKSGLLSRLFQEAEYAQLAPIAIGAALGGGLVWLMNRRARETFPAKIGVIAGGVLGGMFVVPIPLLAAGLPLGLAFALSTVLIISLFIMLDIDNITHQSRLASTTLGTAVFGAVGGALAWLNIAAMEAIRIPQTSILEGFVQTWADVSSTALSWSTPIAAAIGAVLGGAIAFFATLHKQQKVRTPARIQTDASAGATAGDAVAPSASDNARADLVDSLRWIPACVLLAATLHIASAWLSINEGVAPQRFTWSMGLGLAAIVPQIVIAAVFLELGKLAGMPALGASGTGFFLCLWGMQILSVGLEDFLPWWLRIVLLLLAALLGAIVLAMLDEDFPEVRKKHRVLLIVAAAPLVGGALGIAWLLKLPFHALVLATLVAMFVPLVGVLVFPVWNAAALVVERRKLGIAAVALAGFQLLAWLAGVVALVVVISALAATMSRNELWNDEDFFATLQPFHVWINVGAIVIEAAWALLATWFWLSLQKRAAMLFPVPSAASASVAG